MKIRTVNRCLLITILVMLLFEMVIHIPSAILGDVISKGLILAILFFLAKRDGVSDVPAMLGFHRVSLPVLGLCVLFFLVTYPVTLAVSYVTNLFTGKLGSLLIDAIVKPSLLESVICTAVIPALFEEILLRGMAFQTYARTGRFRAAVLLSALLFALIHMNLAQFFFCFVIGIYLALLVDATGSVWSGIAVHFCNNFTTVMLNYLSAGEGEENSGAFYIVLAVLAAAGVALSFLLLKLIRRAAGREGLRHDSAQPPEKLVTPALILLIVCCGVLTVLTGVAVLLPF